MNKETETTILGKIKWQSHHMPQQLASNVLLPVGPLVNGSDKSYNIVDIETNICNRLIKKY